MRTNRLMVILGIVLAAVLVGVLHQRAVRELRRANAGLAGQIALAQTQVAELRAGREPLERELAQQRAISDELTASSAALSRELAPGDTDARWSTPPAQLPDWDPDSPYVWLDKELLTRFPVQPFSPEGNLNPSVASVLMVEPGQVQELNTRLSRLVAEYRSQEAAHARRSDQELPGMPSGEGERFTIEVPPLPEVGAALKDQFEQTLVDQLGRPRADLVWQTAEGWIQEQLNGFGADSRVFSVGQQPDHTYQIFIKSGISQMSVGGDQDFNHVTTYIPPHLRALFAPLDPSRVSEIKSEP